MEISKLDASKRQLDTAINLFFKQADPISTHTLTAAAHQLLMDIGRSANIKSVIKENPFIKKEYFKEYIRKVNEAENFFKHANMDSNALLKFNSEQTEYLLLDAVEMYMQLTSERPEDMSIFRIWFLCKYPNYISPDIQERLNFNGINIQSRRTKSKPDFYVSMKDALIHSNK